ncbi:DUF1887 family CARF protein [Geomonas paludis]|uniref:DUF1887 family CARF protein n=1 Tax=Geomonas paludis TaxID=2740185 RepID=A0ABY4LHN6_9BACT|nr:DUF1887 family CARF protein [Geomonas paludis]UPU37501.1 DUF1887 family CARF protein [Geomonas paludis]
MKKYLMTWYGITDFRASLGLERGHGPVLAALLAEEYTDVVILGFTNPGKAQGGAGDNPAGFQEGLSALATDPASAWSFINLFANTEAAHAHFVGWLQRQLLETGKQVAVNFNPVVLRHLNDTEGIYEAATHYLGAVATAEGEKLVTLYLSPGTPVMAFVWAFAALRHPNLKKRLIAASQADRPPETIVLPNEWLEWHGRQVHVLDHTAARFDVVFHLFGEQRMPNLLGVLQFPSKKHIFVNSAQFPAHVMKHFMDDAEFAELPVDPYDPEQVRSAILDYIARLSPEIRIGFNLTGGTKLMYAGALAACRKVNAMPFYFNGRSNKVIFLNDFESVDTRPITSVETFIKLNGDNLFISKAGHWDEDPGRCSPDRKNLTHLLWQERQKIARLYLKLSQYNDGFRPFEIAQGNIYVKLASDKSVKISIGSSHFEFKGWPDVAQYLSGRWFEEYAYMKLKTLLDKGLIQDLRIGIEVSFKETAPDTRGLTLSQQLNGVLGQTYQEFDIVFTDGRRLYVIECKAGKVTSEHIMKLQNITRYFGGIEGRAILVSCFELTSKIVSKKIDDSKNLQVAAGGNFFKQLETMIQAGGGR